MYRATKDIILPTTITGSLPRPSWYTENLGTRHFLQAMVNRRFREQYEDALDGLSARPGTRRPRHPVRWRLPVRRRRRRAELDRLSDQPHDRLRPGESAADAGRPRRRVLSARPHPARLSGVAGDADGHRADRPRQSAIHRDVEGGAALHRAAGQVRRRVGRDRRLLGAGPLLQERAGPHDGDRRGVQPGIPRAGRRRLPGDPDRGAAAPPDPGARHFRRR